MTTEPQALPTAEGGREEWRRLVTGVLRKQGRIGPDDDPEAPEDLLEHVTADGLHLAALYPPARDAAVGLPGRAPFVRGGTLGRDETGWQVRQRVDETDAETASTEALSELENGSTSLWLAVGGPGRPAVAELGRVLDGVLLDLAPVVLEPHDDALAAARSLLDLTSGVGDGLRLQLGLDPLGELARRGPSARPGLSPGPTELAALLHDLPPAPGVRAVVVDALPFHEAGATETEELGLGLAAGITYLRELADAGVDVTVAASRLEFRWAATTDQFATISKLRAARLLWDRALAHLDVPAEARGQQQHAVTSTVMTTRRDPWVNLLRVSVAAFAAGVGGADAVTVLPFDHALGRPSRQGKRLARNAQSLLVMESHLARVQDAAGGSGYVESRTQAVAEAGWDLFREVEAVGGVRRALESGWVAGRLAATWERRSAEVARLVTPVLGVSVFPDVDEKPLAREGLDDAPGHDPTPGEGLSVVRLAAGFEALRDRAAAASSPPVVPVVVLGPVTRSAARLDWVSGLLAAGGMRAVPTGADQVDDAPVVLVAGSDRDYAETGPAAVQAVRAAGTAFVVVAGRLDGLPDADAAVARGDDVLAFLTDVLDRLETP